MSNRIAKEDFASNGSNITSGTVADARIDAAIARDSEVTSAITTERSAVATLTNKTLTSPAITTPTGIVKGDVGLGNVDNTADTAKPVSTAQQTALNLKANLASPTFTGTVTIPTGASITAPTGLVKGDVGLGNVDNTADASKAFAGAQITSGTVALARLPTGTNSSSVVVGGVITGAGPTGDASHTLALTYNAAGQITAVTNNAIAIAQSAVTSLVSDLALKAPLASPTFTGTVTAAALTVSGQTLMGYASAVTAAQLELKDGMHIYGTQELQYIGTGENVASSVDVRRINGSFAGGYVAVTNNTRLGGIRVGGSNSSSALYDCAQIMVYADGAFDTTSNGGTGKSPSRMEFYTTAAASAGGSQTLAMTIGSNQSLTVVGGTILSSTLAVTGDVSVNTNKFTVTASSGNTLVAGTLDVTGATTLTGALTGNGGATVATLVTSRGVALAPALFMQRINGTLASPTAIQNGQSLGNLAWSGQYDTTVGHTKTGAQIAAVATSNWTTTTAGGAKLVFSTMPDAAAIATSMVLDQDGTMTLTPNVLATAAALTISSPATNDDPIEQTFQDRVTTTNATPTNFGTQISVPAATAVQVEAFVTARRTGGSAGTANDIACYRIFGAFNSGGQVGTTTKTAFESQAAFDCDFGAVASNVVPITVTGATNNNVTWHVTYRVRSVGT